LRKRFPTQGSTQYCPDHQEPDGSHNHDANDKATVK
jgi:hypothetical protein